MFWVNTEAIKSNSIDTLKISIFHDEKKIGEYKRNYCELYKTFHPFKQKDKNGIWRDYALFSSHYSKTSVMRLPSCKVIAVEKEKIFCPVEYYVPYTFEDESDGLEGKFGFVAGCIWGDDSSYKLQYLDLSQIEEGIITRDDHFGYFVLPNASLKDIIDTSPYFVSGEFNDPYISISAPISYDMSTNKINNLWNIREVLSRDGYSIIKKIPRCDENIWLSKLEKYVLNPSDMLFSYVKNKIPIKYHKKIEKTYSSEPPKKYLIGNFDEIGVFVILYDTTQNPPQSTIKFMSDAIFIDQ
jgi:hypothetical protein